MKQVYIYKIYFPAKGKCYIGQTDDLQRRMAQHLRKNSAVCHALHKYDDWQVSVLHTCKTREVANTLEIEEIRNYNSIAPNGYNLTRGGEGGDTFTNNPNKEERREKIRQASLRENLSSETLEKRNKAHSKENLSSETLEKMSKAHSKENLSIETIEKHHQGMLGKKNAKGCKHSVEANERKRERMLGEQRAKGKHWKQSVESIAKRLLTRYKNQVEKLEQELKDVL